MKSMKMLYLAALAVLMTMALVATPSALAEPTGLCGADPEHEEATEAECKPITHVHEVSVSKAVLLTSVKVECDVLFLGDEIEESETPLELEGKFTYTNCGSCTVTEENGPSIVQVLHTEHETGEVTEESLIKVVCGAFLNCAFNGEGLKGTAKGVLLSTQKNGEVSIQGQTLNKETGFLCPETFKLDITTTPLQPTYIKPIFCVAGTLYYTATWFNICWLDVGKPLGRWDKRFRR